MTLFLLFLLGSLAVGWLARRQGSTFRLAIALLTGVALAMLYFGLERLI